jgi:hypothetical protein
LFLLLFITNLSPQPSSSCGRDKDGPLFTMRVGGGCPMPPPSRGLIVAMPRVRRTPGALCYELLVVTKVENNCLKLKIMSSNLHRFYFTNDPDRGALCSS